MFNVLIKSPTIRLEDGLIASDDREGGASVESFLGQRVEHDEDIAEQRPLRGVVAPAAGQNFLNKMKFIDLFIL